MRRFWGGGTKNTPSPSQEEILNIQSTEKIHSNNNNLTYEEEKQELIE